MGPAAAAGVAEIAVKAGTVVAPNRAWTAASVRCARSFSGTRVALLLRRPVWVLLAPVSVSATEPSAAGVAARAVSDAAGAIAGGGMDEGRAGGRASHDGEAAVANIETGTAGVGVIRTAAEWRRTSGDAEMPPNAPPGRAVMARGAEVLGCAAGVAADGGGGGGGAGSRGATTAASSVRSWAIILRHDATACSSLLCNCTSLREG